MTTRRAFALQDLTTVRIKMAETASCGTARLLDTLMLLTGVSATPMEADVIVATRTRAWLLRTSRLMVQQLFV